MGKAKRREQAMGNSYGKSLRPLQEFKRISVKDIKKPDSLSPDFGHTYVKTFGEGTPMMMEINHPFSFCTNKEGYVSFKGFDESLGTIICSIATAKKIGNRAFTASIKPSIQEKYRTNHTDEWVIPFRFLDESEIFFN